MVRQDEEDRAIAFRASLKRREAAQKARNQALRGDAGALKRIEDGWEPIVLAGIERNEGYAPEDDD